MFRLRVQVQTGYRRPAHAREDAVHAAEAAIDLDCGASARRGRQQASPPLSCSVAAPRCCWSRVGGLTACALGVMRSGGHSPPDHHRLRRPRSRDNDGSSDCGRCDGGGSGNHRCRGGDCCSRGDPSSRSRGGAGIRSSGGKSGAAPRSAPHYDHGTAGRAGRAVTERSTVLLDDAMRSDPDDQ